MDEKKNVHLPLFGIPRVWKYLTRYMNIYLGMLFTCLVAAIIDAMYPLFNRYALNNFVAKQTIVGLPVFILLYILILGGQSVINYISVALGGKLEMYLDRDLRNAAFFHLQELSFSYFNRNNVGYVHARVMSDSGRIGATITWNSMDLMWNGAYLVFIIFMMLSINPLLTVYILLLVPAALLLISYFQKHLIRLNRQVREMNSVITGDFNEGITGAKSIKTMVIEEKMGKEFGVDTEKMRKLSVFTTHYGSLFRSTVTLFSAIALSIVLWKGGQITAAGIMMIGNLSVFISYALSILEPIQTIIRILSELIATQVNIERFTNLINTESDVADAPEIVEKYGDTFHPKKENWEPLLGDVEFKDVTFKYPDGEELVLEHFDLKVPRGTNVAIVGETGAGKSTLVNLVCRFFEPTMGQVLIDGRDARERSQLWLHSNIGYVLQTPHLFSGSVRDNLRYGKPDATDEEIWEALRIVSADSVVHKMDNGLDSEVGEGGTNLSTGEKQLLSFARAILCDPRILVLDEATSSIDTVTEKKIQDAIAAVIKGRTSFMIAHRLSTVVDADVILVVQDGKIIEKGKHRELMDAKGYYYELYTRQYENMAADLVL